MCGIAGRFNFRTNAPVDCGILERMIGLLAHRGPDGSGVHVDGPVGLGHRRLAVIDLTAAGRQPMASDDGRVWITYNGEVYNFPEIRRRLEQDGHRFHSRTDTEVLLAAYRQWGTGCLQRFRGMFAFAIWDQGAHTLLLARDRLGKKPLVYRLDEDGLAFASEPKAFLAEPGFQARPAPSALWEYLSYQYVPSPQSAFQGVVKVPPAHYVLVRDGQVSTHRYWKLSYGSKTHLSEADAEQALLDHLEEAVQLRMSSDVPLGVFLSGGVDSATVAALMARSGHGRIKTFSIGFGEQEYNELDYARLVSKRYDTDHHEFIVEPSAVEILPALVWHLGEPFADSSAVPTYYLARLARAHVTVSMNGDGGDEDFAGYERYRAAMLAQRFLGAARLARPWVMEALKMAKPAVRSGSVWSRTERFFESADDSPERRYARWMMHFTPELKNELCTPEFTQAAGAGDSTRLLMDQFAGSDATTFLDALLDVDVNRYLPDDLLVKVDLATMAHGLEPRSPFLDHVVMEFAAGLPPAMKLRGRTGKYLLKRAVRDLVPTQILSRPKMGFGVPIEHWFRGELRTMAEDLLLGPRATARGYFRTDFVRRLLTEHTSGRRSWHYQLWNLLCFEMWHRMFVDERPTGPPAESARL